jgi:protein-S-isoprenylcysteine O-methyltransferase Ste14
MNNLVKQLSSFILPVTVSIVVPLLIEKNISAENLPALIVGVIIMLSGLVVMFFTISSFIKIGKGTLAPWSPTQKLVISGLFAYVRNPMIMGVLTVLIGESVAILSINIFTWAVHFFLINNIFFSLYEEPDLEKKFGEEYREYKKNVPRWIPRTTPFKPKAEKNN